MAFLPFLVALKVTCRALFVGSKIASRVHSRLVSLVVLAVVLRSKARVLGWLQRVGSVASVVLCGAGTRISASLEL